MRRRCALPQVGKNQANMFTVNTLRQRVNVWQAAAAQKLGSLFGPADAGREFVPIVPAAGASFSVGRQTVQDRPPGRE